MSFRLPHKNWVIAHVLEALGVVGLFIAFDYIQLRCVEPGFYIFLFALWFALSLFRYYMYMDKHPIYHKLSKAPVVVQFWHTSDTFIWVIFILFAFYLYETAFRR